MKLLLSELILLKEGVFIFMCAALKKLEFLFAFSLCFQVDVIAIWRKGTNVLLKCWEI